MSIASMQLWKFKSPSFDGEARERYVMIEDRGDRALYMEVEVCKELNYKPQSVFMKSDMVEA